MPIPPVTYGFVLDAYYVPVRRWALTGQLPSKESLHGLLNIDETMIKQWVKFNEAHHRMISDRKKEPTKPFLSYVDYCDQCEMVEGC